MKKRIDTIFPSTADEAEHLWEELGGTRDALWMLADRLRHAEAAGTLTDAQLEIGQNLASSLLLDMTFALDGLGALILTALETSTVESVKAAAAAWAALSAKDREYLRLRLVGRWGFVDDFLDAPREAGMRVAGD